MDPSLFPDQSHDEPQPHAWDRFASVVVNRSLDREEGLTYGIDSSMSDLRVGELVRVPLGRGSKRVEGVVISIDDSPNADIDPAKVKPIAERLKAGYPKTLIELGRWISRYYCCPIGLALTSMTPADVRKGTGRRETVSLRPTGAKPAEKLPKKTRQTWDRLRELDGSGELDWPMPADALREALGEKSKTTINRLLREGLLEEVRTSDVRARAMDIAHSELRADIELTDDQRSAVGRVVANLGTFRPHVLFGVTGSGKTEVYLRILTEVLERGETGIVLVPEISLTPQTVSRFIERFGEPTVAVLHSGLTGAQRNREWGRASSGEARIVVGARSAIFAPFGEETGRPGVIIVDEEHDTSYKQDQVPRYHARDVAIRRAQLEGCPVVLGSATPSLESWHNAQRSGGRGAFELIRLPSRVGGGKLPKVEVVDLMEERRVRKEHGGDADGASYALGPTLAHALKKTLARGAQAMLLLNRRGFASYCCCADIACGWVLTCDSCDSSMVYHRAGSARTGEKGLPKGYVRCHHCFAQQLLPKSCPRCGKKTIALGTGTQRVEEDLNRMFPDLAESGGMVRVDSDVMHSARDYFRVLGDFRAGRTKLLLGTQMIAKGLDFPDVELVGVINADTALSMPDFRASERTYQLVSQVAGRAGRSLGSGATSRVIVQTMNPEERAIRDASAHDFESFARYELATRERAKLPPHARMARIVSRDEDAMKAEERITRIAGAIRSMGDDASRIEVLGPSPCALSRLHGQYRFSIELFAPDAPTIQRVLTNLRSHGMAVSDTRTAIDVDPVSLM